MAVYRQIYITFWQDQFILDLTPEEKYFYIYLMSNSKTTQCGCYEIPKKIIELETGYNRETVDKLLARFIQYGKIAYDERTGEVLLINWLKYNPINNINIEKCVTKEIEQIKSEDLKGALEGLIRGCHTPTKKKEKEEEEEEEETKEKEEEAPSASEAEKDILKILKETKGYPFTYNKDLEFIRQLSVEFPDIDLLTELKKFKTYKLDRPIKKKSNPRLQVRNWIDNALKYKTQKGGDRPDYADHDITGKYDAFYN